MPTRDNLLLELLRNLIECKMQAEHDLCGEQREWHLPRLNNVFTLAAQLFPLQLAEAMGQAHNPWGEPLAAARVDGPAKEAGQ